MKLSDQSPEGGSEHIDFIFRGQAYFFPVLPNQGRIWRNSARIFTVAFTVGQQWIFPDLQKKKAFWPEYSTLLLVESGEDVNCCIGCWLVGWDCQRNKKCSTSPITHPQRGGRSVSFVEILTQQIELRVEEGAGEELK